MPRFFFSLGWSENERSLTLGSHLAPVYYAIRLLFLPPVVCSDKLSRFVVVHSLALYLAHVVPRCSIGQ